MTTRVDVPAAPPVPLDVDTYAVVPRPVRRLVADPVLVAVPLLVAALIAYPDMRWPPSTAAASAERVTVRPARPVVDDGMTAFFGVHLALTVGQDLSVPPMVGWLRQAGEQVEVLVAASDDVRNRLTEPHTGSMRAAPIAVLGVLGRVATRSMISSR